MNHLVKKEARHRDACGQFALAMVTGKPVEEVAAQIGTWGGTSTAQIFMYLMQNGFGDGNFYKTADISRVGVIVINTPLLPKDKREGHAVAFKDGVIYDSNGYTFGSVEELERHYSELFNQKWKLLRTMYAEPTPTREFPVGGLLRGGVSR